ncbi:hypothetical protein [Eisenbergiella sp.]
MRMRLYLFELEKLVRRPLLLAAAAGSLLFTVIGWRVYAVQADFHAGEAQAVMLLLMELHGLLAAMLIIIFTAPVFAEEYSLKMEELLMTAANGMENTAHGKAAAALTFSLTVFVILFGSDYFFIRCVWEKEIWRAGMVRPAAEELDTILTASCGQIFAASVLLGICAVILLAGAVYWLSALSHTPFQAAAGAGIGYFTCLLLYHWGIKAGFPPAAYLCSFSPVVLARFQLFRKPWEGEWFGGFYLWLVPVVTLILCAIFFLSGRRRFLRKPV